MIGFEGVTNIPKLGCAYADSIITQVDIALWELRRGCLSPKRKAMIRQHRRHVEGLTQEAARRIA